MSETSKEATPCRSLKENLRETVEILRHSSISTPKAILLAIAAVAVAAIVL